MSNSEKKNKEVKRDVREEMITDDYVGPLYVEDKYKREGYHRHIADGSRRGWISQLIKMGYSIVQDDTKIGNNSVASVNSIDSAVRVFLSTNEKEPSGILMEIPDELYTRRKEREARAAKEQLNMIGKTNISSQVGEVTIGGETFK